MLLLLFRFVHFELVTCGQVTDFGLAARLEEWEDAGMLKKKSRNRRKHRKQHSACGTPSYAAPELFTAATRG